eukprot:11089-Pelagomonas_calceolata.AAC.7
MHARTCTLDTEDGREGLPPYASEDGLSRPGIRLMMGRMRMRHGRNEIRNMAAGVCCKNKNHMALLLVAEVKNKTWNMAAGACCTAKSE